MSARFWLLWQIERGDYRPSRWMIWMTTAIVMLLGILSIPLVVNRELNAPASPPSRNIPGL